MGQHSDQFVVKQAGVGNRQTVDKQSKQAVIWKKAKRSKLELAEKHNTQL